MHILVYSSVVLSESLMIPKYVRSDVRSFFFYSLLVCVRCAPFDRYSLCYRYSLLLWLVKFKSLIIIRQNMDDDDKSTTEQQDTHTHTKKKKSRAPLITCIAILYDTQQTTETEYTPKKKTKISTENKIKANTCRKNEASAATKKAQSARTVEKKDRRPYFGNLLHFSLN